MVYPILLVISMTEISFDGQTQKHDLEKLSDSTMPCFYKLKVNYSWKSSDEEKG